MFELITWTADGVQTIGLPCTDYAACLRLGRMYLGHGCIAYRVRPV